MGSLTLLLQAHPPTLSGSVLKTGCSPLMIDQPKSLTRHPLWGYKNDQLNSWSCFCTSSSGGKHRQPGAASWGARI